MYKRILGAVAVIMSISVGAMAAKISIVVRPTTTIPIKTSVVNCGKENVPGNLAQCTYQLAAPTAVHLNAYGILSNATLYMCAKDIVVGPTTPDGVYNVVVTSKTCNIVSQ